MKKKIEAMLRNYIDRMNSLKEDLVWASKNDITATILVIDTKILMLEKVIEDIEMILNS